jgi:hypothetical protein
VFPDEGVGTVSGDPGLCAQRQKPAIFSDDRSFPFIGMRAMDFQAAGRRK